MFLKVIATESDQIKITRRDKHKKPTQNRVAAIFDMNLQFSICLLISQRRRRKIHIQIHLHRIL